MRLPKDIMHRRFQYWWPWRCTFWYRPRFERAGDEYCNSSLLIGLGPLGTLVFFKPFGRMRTAEDGTCDECLAEWERSEELWEEHVKTLKERRDSFDGSSG